MDVKEEEPTTPNTNYDSRCKQELEQKTSSITSTGGSSVGSNIVGISKSAEQHPWTCNSGVGPNNYDDQITPLIGKLNLDSDSGGDTSGSKHMQYISATDLTSKFSEESEYSDVSQDSVEESETTSGSSITFHGIEVVKRGDFVLRKDFPRAPTVEDTEKEEEQIRKLKKEKRVKDDNDIIKSLERFKRQYQRTKPRYDSLKQLKEEKKSEYYKDFWELNAEMTKDEVCEKIRKIMGLYVEQNKNGEGYHFEFTKEKQIKYVEELERYVLNGKSTYRCEFENEQSKKVFARIDSLLNLIHQILMDDMTVNLREIPYGLKGMFDNSSQVEYAVQRICKEIQCTRDRLNIFASAKGKIVGDVSFTVTKGGTSHTTNCQPGISIEPRHVVENLEFECLSDEDLLLIMVVEKDTIFQRLKEANIHKRFRCIIITGCGMPDHGTRTLLHKVQKELSLPVVFLGDHNVGGLNIYLNYLCGSENMVYDSNLCTPSIKWLGLSHSDLIEHDIPTGDDRFQGLENLLKKEFFKKYQELAEDIGKMETKVDIEVMMQKVRKYLTEIYLPLKFEELGSRRRR